MKDIYSCFKQRGRKYECFTLAQKIEVKFTPAMFYFDRLFLTRATEVALLLDEGSVRDEMGGGK